MKMKHDNMFIDFRIGKKEHFWGKRKKTSRPGSMASEDVKKLVEELGTDRKVKIRRIDVMGDMQDAPIEVVITGLFSDHFSAKVVNLERKLIEKAATSGTVYLKGGGGLIDFYYDDGDIKEIIVDVDESIMGEIDTETASEIIVALEEGDTIRVSYFDNVEKSAVNCEGEFLKRISEVKFILLAKRINSVELPDPHEIELDSTVNPILDIQII
jgi:hypothetical protein